MVHQLEEVLLMWYKQIEQVLTESEQMRKEADDSGPLTELEHWKRMSAKFNSIIEQIKGPNCRAVVNTLNANRSRTLKKGTPGALVGNKVASVYLKSESEPEACSERVTLRSPALMPRASAKHRSKLGPAHVDLGRRHRHSSSWHRHRSWHSVDPMLGELLKGIMDHLDSLEVRSRVPPETQPTAAASSPGPFSLAPSSPPQVLTSEPTTSASVSALPAQVPDLIALGPSSKFPTLRRVSETPDPGQAGMSSTLLRRVIPSHMTSEKVGSREVWCEAEEGLNPGEVSEAFYTSFRTDSEEDIKSDPPAQNASFWALIENLAGVLALKLSSASVADQSHFMQVLQG
nr:PREDICTED: uncharacterized protein LOC106706922 [Latimeria chalumnae]|eukprot:XP_014354016.1 PREDICTED: uncharacterized protein LOC106706922 [Latimeria chalumnae]